MPGDTSRRNGRKGGRPKGRKSPATIEREATLKAYRERVCRNAQRLLDAEMTVALGCAMLFRKPKNGKGKVERVTDEETIRRYLGGELDHDELDWYFIVTERPDSNTIRGMFDRTFDKPAQRVAVTGEDGGAVEIRWEQ